MADNAKPSDALSVEQYIEAFISSELPQGVDAEKFRGPLQEMLKVWHSAFPARTNDSVRLRSYFSWIADSIDGYETVVMTRGRFEELNRIVESHERRIAKRARRKGR